MGNHKLSITPTAVEATRGFFINTGCSPKQLEMKNVTSGDQVKVVVDSSSDPLAFVDEGIFQDVSGGTVTKLSAGISMTFGKSETNALLPASFKEDVNGAKAYFDVTAREILAFEIEDNTKAALDEVVFNVDGVTKTLVEGTDWTDGATAELTAVALAAYITASVANVTAVAEGINVYLIKEVGHTVDSLSVTSGGGTVGIVAHDQPVVFDMEGNSAIAEPNLKGIFGKLVFVNPNPAIITIAEKLQFDIQI